jgi:uncharacterized protein YcnI
MPKHPYLILCAVLVASPASAHVELERGQAPIGSPYRAVFVVPHGCAGSPTVRLRVQIPEGVIAQEPAPKPGWTVETVKGKFAAEYDYKGGRVSDGIREVAWSGGKLPDKTREEFTVETYLPDSLKPNTTLYFPVVQECEQGVSRWIEIPAQGAAHSHEGKWPAPGVKLAPPLQ